MSPTNNDTEMYDSEGQKILKELQQGRSSGRYNPLDAVWKHPTTGGTVYVGNVEAASTIDILRKHKITHVVNCTDNMPCYHDGTREVTYHRFVSPSHYRPEAEITYHRFDIASWWQKVKDEDSAIAFTTPVLTFVGDAIANGNSVLVHCLAGAHRAGTTGCLVIMHYANLPPKESIAAAKKLRPVIDPIGTLPDLLNKCRAANLKSPPESRFPGNHFR